MGLHFDNIFAGLNSADKGFTGAKVKKGRTGLNPIPGMLTVGYDPSNGHYLAGWNLPPTSIWYGAWDKQLWISCTKPQPIWKNINWAGSVEVAFIEFSDNADSYNFRAGYEEVFGPVPTGPWYIPTFLKLKTVNANRSWLTKPYPLYLIQP